MCALAASILLVGCAAPAKYTWGNYDRSLYNYYKDTAKSAEHIAELESIIQSAEKTQSKVAPGIHAEYGYFLMQQGKSNEAIAQFEKEKVKWPESTQLMNSIIKMTASQASKPLASKD
jgi:hypothetical protein